MNPATLPEADAEARAHDDHHDDLRLWLRLLTCTQLIEQRIRSRLRARFATTLPRFDLMAQLERFPEGLKMKELSQRMMVTNGNVTGITDQLVAEGLVQRHEVPGDRRAYRVCLTAQGAAAFQSMAREHEQWIVECFAQLQEREKAQLYQLLAKTKQSLRGQA